MKDEIMEVFSIYQKALVTADFETLFSVLSDDIKWHMGGKHKHSGLICGKKELAECFSSFSKESNGTFKVIMNWAASNGCFVVASVVSVASRGESDELKMPGIDLFKIENGKIQEIWTFAQFQEIEDKYWG